MHREYEFTLIVRGDIGEQESTKVFQNYENLMTGDGGEILRRDDWGVKRLSYPMKKCFRGHYVFYDFVGTTANLSEMKRLMRIDENVLRYMDVRLDTKNRKGTIDIAERKAEIARAEVAAKEAEAARKDGQK